MNVWDEFDFWQKRDFLEYYKKRVLLSKGQTNSKTAKNTRETRILYLAPAFQNTKGWTVCSHATAGCISACLFSAGRGAFQSVQVARSRRTEFYLQYKHDFLTQLLSELTKFDKLMKKRGTVGAVRLNGTSDIDFLYSFDKGLDISLLDEFQNLVFYDYTKNPARVKRYTGSKYNLCFSRSDCNDRDTLQVLNSGGTVSVVFRDDDLPTTWHGFRVVDGDKRDDLMLDVRNVVLGLRAKGKAKKDASGFVI
jgi:hypothetical protein